MNLHLTLTTAKITLKSHLSFVLSAALILPLAFGAEPPSAPQSSGVPITLSLDKSGYVTAVIERADGRRVYNLASEVKAQAGQLTFNWDFYDVGVQKGEKEPYTRALVEPGTYTMRGLVHDGIDLRYEMSVYSPGTPPWKTEDSLGTWMGDHAAPSDVMYLAQGPDGSAAMVLATSCAESGHALSYTDLSGKKFKGINSDNFNGAKAIARDVAAGAEAGVVYFVNNVGLCAGLTEKGKHQVLFKYTPKKPYPIIDEYGFLDLAVRQGLAVISNIDNRENIDTTTGNLLVVDIAKQTMLANLETGPSRGVAFGPDGKLYAIIGQAVVRYALDAAGVLTKEAEVVTGLVEPRRLRFDDAGNFYVGEWGTRHQIKVFDKTGKLVRTIGKTGGPQIGKYDEERMDRPDGMAVDAQGQLWVAENSHVPKRISLWNAGTGKFIRASYGGPQYAGGGTLDPVAGCALHLLLLTTQAVVPEHTVKNGAVHLTGVGPDNPIIYDNDWWFDVFDNNYLWAQASLGNADLRGNIVSRDMWDWEKGYLYPMQKCVDDAEKALKLARDSGLKNIPDATLGSDRVLTRPESGRIEDTVAQPTPGSQLIIVEARQATPEKPLLIVSGGPLTTVANALLLAPDIAPRIVVFNILVSHYGYNGKDGWAAYIVAKQTRYVDWGGRSFWDRNSVFTAKDFEVLPQNPFCDDMRRLIKSDLGQANQLGDGAPLVWLFNPGCWTGVESHRAEFKGKAVEFNPAKPGEAGDVLVIPKASTDLKTSREEFFRVLTQPGLFP